MNEHEFQVGKDAFVAQDSPTGRFSAFLEDDGERGYFYAVDAKRSDNTILDAVHIYNVANVVDRDRPQRMLSRGSVEKIRLEPLLRSPISARMRAVPKSPALVNVAKALRPQPLRKLLFQLGDLRRDHKHAVRLP